MFTIKRKVAIGIGGGAMIAIAAGIVLGLESSSKQRQADVLCADPQLPCAQADAASALNHSAHRLAIGADVAFGAGAAFAIGAGVLWLTGTTPEHVHVHASADDVSVAIGGRF